MGKVPGVAGARGRAAVDAVTLACALGVGAWIAALVAALRG